MAKKTLSKLPKRKGEFTYHGKSLEELKRLSLEEFALLVPARQRRTIQRGFSEQHKKLLHKVRSSDPNIRTHLRDMIVLPEMLGMKIAIHSGKEFTPIEMIPEMLGHYFGEFVMTRKRVSHGAAGVGATRSSKFIPLK
ncbi:ribosomal protein S19/S15 [Candidatus Methanoperedens nitroreducens]|uniref:Small ribosomal subunit protein uS19 n=1 Tax=Candidatus Methanoperedens nitratireducens TaxID=1392998 RepID=A0A062VC75_9EURY|nr:30S ribosomal protein S19 [Candidatus Methanoperedens nitroreducens]KCZ73304.1 ribosomal protein S19/S15 [Candidatus Methanoperedens nitroreducens]MDJ1422747.1 30S ribosomal protein S19 [Candidatus Methanoperedens sp.]